MIRCFKAPTLHYMYKFNYAIRETSALQTASACFKKKLFYFVKTAIANFGGVK